MTPYPRILQSVLVLMCLVLLPSQARAAEFNDVGPDTAYRYAINWLADHSVVQGYADGSFGVYNTITRAEFLKVVFLAENLGNQIPEVESDSGFSDVVATEWYAKYVAFAKARGTIVGYTDGSFRPHASVTRAEAIKIIVKEFFGETPNYISGLSLLDKQAMTGCYNRFMRDLKEFSWFEVPALFAHDMCILPREMVNDHFLHPADALTRGEAAELSFRARVVRDHSNVQYRGDLDPK